MKSKSIEEKIRVVRRALQQNNRFILAINPRIEGVQLPEAENQAKSVMAIVHVVESVVASLDDKQLEVSIMGHLEEKTILPWASIFAVAIVNGAMMLWSEEVPAELQDEFIRQKLIAARG